MTIRELQEKAGKAVADARAIHAKAEAEKREMTADESAAFDRHMADYDKHKADADSMLAADQRRSRLADADRDLGRLNPRVTEPRARVPAGGDPDDDAETRNGAITFEVRGREFRFEPGEPAHRRNTAEYRAAFNRRLAGTEARDISTALDTDGGYLVTPEMFVGELIKNLDDEVWLRKICRVLPPVPAQSAGFPVRTGKMSTWNWGKELTAPAKDTALKFGKRKLTPHYMTGESLVSRDTLASGVLPVDQLVREEMARDAGELEENSFLLGDGNEKPLGLLVASTDGISAGRDVASGAAAAVTPDAITSMLYSIKDKYRASPSFWIMLHRLIIAHIRKLKDANGQYLWQPSIAAGQPETLGGYRTQPNEFMPKDLTTGTYVMLAGDFKQYYIVDGLDFQIQVLLEKYAETNQNAYLARRKVDGQPVKEEAFARMKLGT